MKKKRLLWIAVVLTLGIVWWKLGGLIAFYLVAALLLALTILYAHKFVTAGKGLGDLEAQRAAHGIEAACAKLAKKTAQGPLRFVVFGDSRNNRRVAAMILEEAAKYKPHLAFHTGDIVRHGTPKEFMRNHINLLPKLDGTPLFCVPGNHDRGPKRDFAAYNALYGADRFAFSHGTCRFVGFNNSTRERVSTDDLAFLRISLEHPEPHKFVFFHIPPLFFEEQALGGSSHRGFTKNAEEMHKLFAEKGVTEVFMAHIHGYATMLRDNVRYTLTAGAGAPLRKDLDEGSIHHFVVLDVDGEKVGRRIVRRSGDAWLAQADPGAK